MYIHTSYHKSISLDPVLSQMNPVHAVPSYFFKTHFNIMLPSTPRFYQQVSRLQFPHQNPACICLLPHKCHRSASSSSLQKAAGYTHVVLLHRFILDHILVTLLTCIFQHGAGSWTDVAGAIIKIPALCHEPRRQWARAWNKCRTNQHSAQTGV